MAPPFTGDDERDRVARLLNAILWVMMIGTVLTVAATSIFGPFRLSGVVLCVLYVLSLLPARHWMMLGRVRLASMSTVATTWLFVSYVLMTDGIWSPATGSFITVIMMAAVTLGSRPALILIGASTGIVFCSFLVERAGWIAPDPVIFSDVSQFVVSASEVIIVGILLVATTRERDRAYREIFTLVQRSPDGMMTLDAQSLIRSVNPAMCEMAAIERAELIGRHFDALGLLNAQSLSEANESLAQVAARGDRRVPQLEIPITRADGSTIWLECKGRAIELEDGTPGIQVVARDVTRRRDAERHLHQMQRLDSIGRLAGGIAHDFNNILMAILGNADLLRSAEPESKGSLELEEIIDAAERGRSLTRQLMLFGGAQVGQPTDVDISDVAVGLRSLLTRLIGEHVRLDIMTQARTIVRCDRSQLEQVIMNLVVNAKDAMTHGGSIAVVVRREASDPTESDRVILTVTDDGRGMDAETQLHAFDPFFTTKGAGHGTGLGLPVVHGIVEQAGGSLVLESEPGRGTTVTLEFPASAVELHSIEAANPIDITIAPETILLVEDDDAVRSITLRFLRRAGYNVHEASSPAEAIETSRAFSGRIDLLLSDVIMPFTSGPQLALRLREQRPDMKVLLMSGYTGDSLEPHLEAGFRAPLVYKPFTGKELRRQVRGVLDDEKA